jgi:DNA-binding CsgD family transcriptional regulator
MVVAVVRDAPVARVPRSVACREALGVRVARSLEAFRTLSAVEVVGDDELRQIRAMTRADEMHDAACVLDVAIRMVSESLRSPARGARGLRERRLYDLRNEMQELAPEIQRELLEWQRTLLRGVGEALHRLRGTASASEMIERATVEVCRSCGVDRCCLFRVEGDQLIVESVHFAGDPSFQEEWSAFARAHPPTLDHRDAEVQALRRHVPVMVGDTSALDGMREVIEAGRSLSYVAAPVTVRGTVIGLIHADRYFAGARVDPAVRDAIGTFAAGFGYALERNALIDRTKSQLQQMREMILKVEFSMEEMLYSGISLQREDRGSIDTAARAPAARLPAESRVGGLLTRRELEVMELMARGASNGDIANLLVISEGTVKSHVKHILRKFRAANRAHAVSTYMRIPAGTSGEGV